MTYQICHSQSGEVTGSPRRRFSAISSRRIGMPSIRRKTSARSSSSCVCNFTPPSLPISNIADSPGAMSNSRRRACASAGVMASSPAWLIPVSSTVNTMRSRSTKASRRAARRICKSVNAAESVRGLKTSNRRCVHSYRARSMAFAGGGITLLVNIAANKIQLPGTRNISRTSRSFSSVYRFWSRFVPYEFNSAGPIQAFAIPSTAFRRAPS